MTSLVVKIHKNELSQNQSLIHPVTLSGRTWNALQQPADGRAFLAGSAYYFTSTPSVDLY